MKANPKSIPMTQPVNRLCGSLPKIGIRPIIDGRRKGVREGLEDQTMGLAKAAKDFLEANLRYSCGLPVECVIADTTIGGFKEAADCAEKFARENVGVSISVTSSDSPSCVPSEKPACSQKIVMPRARSGRLASMNASP